MSIGSVANVQDRAVIETVATLESGFPSLIDRRLHLIGAGTGKKAGGRVHGRYREGREIFAVAQNTGLESDGAFPVGL